jgi:EPS-associated MarR family transcriptional regulator
MSEKPVPRRQAAAQEDVHFRVMRLLEVNPDMSQRDLAAHVGVSLGSLNYCLKALMVKGFVKLENFQNSKHKFKYVYILTPAGVAQKVALSSRFLKRKIQEYEALKAEIDVLELDNGQGSRRKALENGE